MLPVVRAGELPICPPEHRWLIEESDTPGKAGGLMSRAASKAVALAHVCGFRRARRKESLKFLRK